jgi:signal transduction histidine kinase
VGESVPQTVYSDIKRIKQVLFNLVGNAVKFTFQGKITLNFDYHPAEQRLTGDVVDTGVGIREEDA